MATVTDDQVLEILADEARVPVESLTRDARLDTLGVASIDVMSSLFTLEDKYGVVVEAEDLGHVQTLGELLDVVQAKAAAA